MAQLVYGKNVVKQILQDNRKVYKLYLAVQDEQIETLARKKKISIERVDKKALHKLTETDNHQGVAVSMEDYKTYSLEELTERKQEYGFLIMVDEMMDPHNLGAILRTADAVNADGVIFRKDRSVGLTPTVAKVSAGAIDTVRCCEVTNLVRTLQELKKKGYWVIGTDMKGQDYRSLKYDFHAVLVIGNEGKGISRLVREECDYMISLPMQGKIESLNASVSAGILMYEIYNKRFPL
ncbi:MAG: 23S rRNA (guanosine(2251)-2'-O)-methyltransferase RlmB [Solobacterium sp.]|nr:23S rRNA (guanosine(2251)-2'-O)-methyltransferase RlmB [Solobacterium sp.]